MVVLNDIHIDIMDYIVPASCTDTEFRQMWAEFEWENKVRVVLFFISVFWRLSPVLKFKTGSAGVARKLETALS